MEKIVIICVDDEKIILNSLKTQLKENYGNLFLYETAESAKETFEIIDEIMIKKNTKLIVVSDWQMPTIKGDEFLIGVHKKYPLLLKIMLTGQANLKPKKETNLYKCIKKPWVKFDLISCIDSGILFN